MAIGDPRAIIDPGMLAAITPGFFRSRVDIQEPQESQDELGQPVTVWANLLIDVPAIIAPAVAATGEQRQENYTYTELGFTILLAGYYPTITGEMRVIDEDDQTYEVDAVQFDSQKSQTRLTGRRIIV